jgi:VanZ family protein
MPLGPRTRAALAWGPFVCVVVLIFVFSTDVLQGNSVADAMISHGGFPNEGAAMRFFVLFCCLRHIAAFVALGLASFPLLRERHHGWTRAMAACGAVAVLSEVFQGVFTSTRQPSQLDVCLDLASVMTGILLWTYVWPMLMRAFTSCGHALRVTAFAAAVPNSSMGNSNG